MPAKMRHLLRRHAFLLLGLFTLLLFYAAPLLDQAGWTGAASGLTVLMRVLIVPMYLVWLVVSIVWVALVGPVVQPGFLATVASLLGFVAGLVPYVCADYLLHCWRRSRRAD
jgi:hypothetical protein